MSNGDIGAGRTRNRVLLLSVVLAALIGVGVAGAYLVGVAQRNLAAPAAGTSPLEPVGAQSEPIQNDPAQTPAESTISGATPATTAGDGIPATGPTDAELVQVSESAAVSEQAPRIDELITRHFQSINDGDYAAYAASVSNPLTQEAFGRIFGTTLDTDGLIQQITTDSAGATQITLSFISQQSVELAPADLPSACIAWSVVWTIDGPADNFRVGASDPTRTQKVSCLSQ